MENYDNLARKPTNFSRGSMSNTLYIKNYYQNNNEEIIKEFKKWIVCV